MRKRIWIWLAAALAVSIIAGACGSSSPEEAERPAAKVVEEEPSGSPASPTPTTVKPGVLVMATDIPYAPFEFRKDGKEVGLDIDLVSEIARRLDLEVEIVDTDFDTIFTQLAAGRFDVVAAATTITPKREEEVNFSIPYYSAQQSLAIRKGSGIGGVADLGAEHVVAVQRGTTGKMWAEENLPAQGVELRTFAQSPDLYTALEAGQVHGVINDEPNALEEVRTRQGLEIAEGIDTGESYGIAVNPQNKALLEAINAVLREMIDDGAYEQIFVRYPALPPGGKVTA
jgi:ABC-type amino acid transport substrate-binding protein